MCQEKLTQTSFLSLDLRSWEKHPVAIDTYGFSLVVARKEEDFLCIREVRGGWYLPAGRMTFGESFIDCANRETMEEAGIKLNLQGILRIEHIPSKVCQTFRVIFLATNQDDTTPKNVPDTSSLEAQWMTIPMAQYLKLRSPELLEIFKWTESGAKHSPLNYLEEGIGKCVNLDSATKLITSVFVFIKVKDSLLLFLWVKMIYGKYLPQY